MNCDVVNHPILSAKNITAVYNKTVQAVSSISVEFRRGELTCILGPNGSGKSTLLAAVSGIVIPGLIISSPDGKKCITYEGIPVSSFTAAQRAKRICFLPQNEQYIWPYSVRDCVRMGRFAHSPLTGKPSEEDCRISDEKMEMLGIVHLADKNITDISGGELQRVYLARSLAQDAPLMLLDEPFSHLDIYQQYRFLDFIKTICKKHGITAVITIHDINTASLFADSLILLSKGKITAQGPAEKVFTSEFLNEAFGCKFGFYQHPVYSRLQSYPIIE